MESFENTKEKVYAPSMDHRWSSLYKIAGVAALITAIIIPMQFVVFIASPPPNTVIEYFRLFQKNWLLGLLDLDFLLIVDNVLAIPIFLALYVSLKQSRASYMLIATSVGIIGIILLIISREATFTMLSLSDQYFAAEKDIEKTMCLGSGQTMLSIYNGTVFNLSYILGSVALILISWVMLKTNIFSKLTAILGILSNVIALGLYVPRIGIYISLFSVIGLEIWYILITRRLFQLGRLE